MRRQHSLLRREWLLLLFLAAIDIVLFQTIVYTGLRTATAVNVRLLTSIALMVIVLLSWLV